MGTIQANKKRKQLKKEINSNMILISKINKKIQNFITFYDIFLEEEKVEKIQTEIIDDYNVLCASKTKIKGEYELLPQGDAEFASIYLNYNNDLFSLAQHYKKFISELLIGYQILALACNAAKGFALYIYDLQAAKTYLHNSEIFEGRGCVNSLPNSQLFISWGKNKYIVRCIFDLKSKTEKRLYSYFNFLFSGGIYYKKSVYLFGGSINSNPGSKAGIFDIEKNIWYNATPLPNPTSQCSCTVFNDSILIFGSHYNT